jgi:S-formylglutathione hydrolase FrmB
MRVLCLCLTVFVLHLFLACQMPGIKKLEGMTPGAWQENVKVEFLSGSGIKSVPVRIYFPRHIHEGPFRTLIALHDYRGGAKDWGAYTDIARFADEYNFILVCPSMGPTLYETRYYPETQSKWDSIPGGTWIVQVLVPFLRKKYAAAGDRRVTAIAGIGAGARGALLLAAAYPEIFGAAAGLSGYYDNTVITDNRAFVLHYGKYADFRERWEKEDNVIAMAENLRETPVFLGHGVKDKEVAADQSRLLGMKIRQLQKRHEGGYVFEYIEKTGMAHEWRFWKAVTGEMMLFFKHQLGQR